MDIEITCPLGAKCEEIRENRLHRCAWYTQIRGKDPQSEDTIDEWRCAIAWQPILLVENAQTNRGQTQAIESFRNEMTDQNGHFLALAANRMRQLNHEDD